MCQESVLVCFDKDVVPQPLNNCRLKENLSLSNVIFLINGAAWQHYFILVGTKLAEITVLDVLLVRNPRVENKHHAVETLQVHKLFRHF